MAHLSNHAESDLMRAVTHARLLVTSGQGLESIIHELSIRNLGAVAMAMSAVNQELARGHDADFSLQSVADKMDNENLRSFLHALRANGPAAISRLDDLSATIQGNWHHTITAYGEHVQRIISMAAIMFLLSFVPTFLRVFERIPPNPMGIEFHFPNSMEAVLFSFMSIVFAIMLLLLRFR